MTTANVAPVSLWSRLMPSKHDVLRGVGAGMAFCIVLTLGFAAMSAVQCGGVCLPEVASNAVLSLVAGVVGLGPVAAYGGRR